MEGHEKRRFQKYSGTILGLAAGDALGFPTEFLNREQIIKKYGSQGIYRQESHGGFPEGTYSDDTQMTLAVANGILRSKTNSTDEIMRNISDEFVAWSKSPENNRAPGNTCMSGARNLSQGVHYTESGVEGSKGCGAAMRTAPIGLVFYDDLEKLKEVASASATITHDSDVARASAVANAYLVARGIREDNPEKSLKSLEDFTKGISAEFTKKIGEVRKVMDFEPVRALSILGPGWYGHEAVASALYCVLKNDFDYRGAVVMGANADGDSDSIASIAGGIVGSYKGLNKTDLSLVRCLEKRDNLLLTARELYDRKVQ